MLYISPVITPACELATSATSVPSPMKHSFDVPEQAWCQARAEIKR